MDRLRILILEDQEGDIELLKYHASTLEYECEFREAKSEKSLLKALEEFTPDIILSDYKMDGYDGLRAMEHCKTALPHVPFVLVTGTLGEELAVKVIKQGANDFILKEKISELPIGIIKALREANEKREKLKAEEEKNLLFFLSVDMIGIAGKDGVFKTINPAFEKTLGYSETEFLSRPFMDFVHPSDILATQTEMENIIAGNPVVSFTNRYRCKDGSYKWLEWNTKPYGENIFAYARDITERKKNEAEIIKLNQDLEQKVEDRTAELTQTNRMLKDEVLERIIISRKLEEKNKEITDSINYAQRIQHAMVSKSEECRQTLPDSFIFWKPKSIVSGDFYWCQHTEDFTFVATIDCTGHGVPGAMMSMMASSLLMRLVKALEILEPKEILTHIDDSIIQALNEGNGSVSDGMDLALCKIDRKAKTITFAGAQLPLFYYNGKTMEVIHGDRYGIGGLNAGAFAKTFTQQVIHYNPGDYIYLSSDGFYSQFHHSTGKKMMKLRMVNMFENMVSHPAEHQRMMIEEFFNDWKGKEHQVDDVLVLGLRL